MEQLHTFSAIPEKVLAANKQQIAAERLHRQQAWLEQQSHYGDMVPASMRVKLLLQEGYRNESQRLRGMLHDEETKLPKSESHRVAKLRWRQWACRESYRKMIQHVNYHMSTAESKGLATEDLHREAEMGIAIFHDMHPWSLSITLPAVPKRAPSHNFAKEAVVYRKGLVVGSAFSLPTQPAAFPKIPAPSDSCACRA
jgi:hypothetical protein